MIRYKSTRGSGERLTAAQGIIAGMAADKGLYVPEEIPALDIAGFKGLRYMETVGRVLTAFFTDYTAAELDSCLKGAYTGTFRTDDVVPVVKAGGAVFLELYHGRTAAFKDLALSLLPYLLTTAMKKEKEDHKVCILTATSGDTGKAALEAFADVEGTEIIVFYPNDGVSQVQKAQMVTQRGENVHVFAVDGNFDKAQSGVKDIFDDREFRAELLEKGIKLSSANSINIGRLIPQISYYIYGYIKMAERGEISMGDSINICVPTGNFGNILAAYYAGRAGLPVNRLLCASNRNRVLTDFINTGIYSLDRDFYMTNSPSMDILISSNLERLLYHCSGEDAEMVTAMMEDLKNKGRYEVNDRIREEMKIFYGGSCGPEETLDTIREMYDREGYLIDTHTAVAYRVYRDYVDDTGDETPVLIASTASAYKFAASVAGAVGIGGETDGFQCIRALEEKSGIPVPECLRDLDKREVLHDEVIPVGDMREAVRRSL